MNQVYKNIYALYDESWKHKKFGNNYIAIEMFIEKEIIKFVLAVPKDHVENFEKLIGSFYSGSTVEQIPQPHMMEAGKYMYGGEFRLKKDSIFPIKTYEAFEADPMDSLLGAYARVNANEKLGLQILIAPIDDNLVKGLRKKLESIKKGKKSFFKKFMGIFSKIS
ncbi:MAG: hypothetical protein GXP45_07265 [bacterium]|nr:hypothetical protein [bacterium]